MKILQNEAECIKCGDRIYSAHRHDFKYCKCGAIAVDGGMDYLRRVGAPEDYLDHSICTSEELYEACIEALRWADDNNRNELGALCAVARAIRDSGYRIVEDKR